MHKQLTIVDMLFSHLLFFMLTHLSDWKTGNNLSLSFSLYTHMHTTSYAICFVTHAISHACTNSLVFLFLPFFLSFSFFSCSGNHQVCWFWSLSSDIYVRVAGRLITRVDEACLPVSLSLIFSVRERMFGIFFFLLVFFTTISVLHIYGRGCLLQK
jgi:hypothetical protein